VAVIVGRKRQREYERWQQRLAGEVAACQRCGAVRPREELEVQGWGPFARLVCRQGCTAGGKGEGAQAAG
jgi:hypothetical protein